MGKAKSEWLMENPAYETVIGLEVHIQLRTNSKAFCGDRTSFGQEPNSQVSPVSLAHPGTLPRLNQRHLEYAVALGLAVEGTIHPAPAFDRKNYFYADLPKGYQITQDRAPICWGGRILIRPKGQEPRWINLHHIHMEEDAGKSLHEADPHYSLIDLNRAGVPLLEMVTEPDFRSAEEVDAFIKAVRQLVRYLGISDGNMEEGSLRCDVNVSVRPRGDTELRERCEIKNLNSMRYARQAIAYEVKRQIAQVEQGKVIRQQTLQFNPATGVTRPLREKEHAHDYRYFPEPDLPAISITEDFLQGVRDRLPKLPETVFHNLQQTYGLQVYDARLLSEERETAEFFEVLVNNQTPPKLVANLLINKILPHCKAAGIPLNEFPVSQERLRDFIQLIATGKVSASIAYEQLFPLLLKADRAPEELAAGAGLLQRSDADYLATLVEEVVAQYPEKVAAYRKGKKGLIGFFMGEVMKKSKGTADPKASNKLLQEILAP